LLTHRVGGPRRGEGRRHRRRRTVAVRRAPRSGAPARKSASGQWRQAWRPRRDLPGQLLARRRRCLRDARWRRSHGHQSANEGGEARIHALGQRGMRARNGEIAGAGIPRGLGDAPNVRCVIRAATAGRHR
jgi:hypothetical protein